MNKLSIFAVFAIVVGILMSVSNLKSDKLPANQNAKFDFEKTKNAHEVSEHMQTPHHEVEVAIVPEEKAVVVVAPKLDSEELKRGAKIYTNSGKCTTCHGNNAEGKKSQKAPRLAGQYDWYLEMQLKNMKAGIRSNPIMNPYLKTLSEQDMKDVALYLSKYEWPVAAKK
jgi:cytochrome c553